MRGLVHELRNPLAAILTAANLLASDSGVEEETEMLLGVVHKEAHRMNRILTEFSHFAKPPAPHVVEFDLAGLAREVVAELQRDGVLSEQILVHDHLPSALEACADPHHAGLALRNVIENAAEALGEGGSIVLTAKSDDEAVSLLIEDDNSGLTPEQLALVFQPFYSTKPTSTGLGLSIARMALRASGGDIHLESRHPDESGDGEKAEKVAQSHGTRAVLRLPVS